jgi:hypothetical protein
MKAFPTPSNQNEQGMDLRDYFAAQAMQAILSSGKWGPKTADELHYDDHYESVMNSAMCAAEGAYQMADAMLKARAL